MTCRFAAGKNDTIASHYEKEEQPPLSSLLIIAANYNKYCVVMLAESASVRLQSQGAHPMVCIHRVIFLGETQTKFSCQNIGIIVIWAIAFLVKFG